jgi:4-hydroxy-3-methylbut-2-enyl diphosphate reductase
MEKSLQRQLFVAEVHGFCNGVRRALDTVEKLLTADNGSKVCVFNEIVHNNFVVDSLKKRGVSFVQSLDEVPPGATLVWSAHGVPPELKREAEKHNISTVDATCPLVQKVHKLAAERTAAGEEVIFIGHRNHPETVGVMGCGKVRCVSNETDIAELPDFACRRVAVLTQTTLCANEVENLLELLKKRYAALQVFSGICYATGERQQAVRDLIEQKNIDTLLVIGSPRSSNSNRLCDVARQYNVPAILIDDPEELMNIDLTNVYRLGLTAGASAPEILLNKALKILTEKHLFKLYEE